MQRHGRSLALGTVAVVVAGSWLLPEPAASGPRYLVAKYPLEQGLECRPQYFGMATSRRPPPGALTDQRLEACTGNRILRTLRPGDWLTWSHLEVNPLAQRLPKGTRAYSVASPKLRFIAGDRVDVILRPTSNASRPLLLLEGVRVMRGTNKQKQTLLAVRPDEVTLLENAGRRGTLTLVLRNPGELPKKRVHQKRATTRKVPVWTEEP